MSPLVFAAIAALAVLVMYLARVGSPSGDKGGGTTRAPVGSLSGDEDGVMSQAPVGNLSGDKGGGTSRAPVGGLSGDEGNEGACARENLCPAQGGAGAQCCLGTEVCGAPHFLCCAKKDYQPPRRGAPAACCPAERRKASGGCCAVGTSASGDACLESSTSPKFYCATGGCEQCHSAGAPVKGLIACSELPPTKKTYDSLFECTSNEKDCRGTCAFVQDEELAAPWSGVCEQNDLECACDPGKLPDIWRENQKDRAELLGDGNRCLPGTEPWPTGTGACLCSRWYPADCAVVRNQASCFCRPIDENQLSGG